MSDLHYHASAFAKLVEMRTAKDSSLWLYCSKYGTEWTCSFEIESKELNLKISRSAETPEAAVHACYDAWEALQTGVPDARPTLLMSPSGQPDNLSF